MSITVNRAELLRSLQVVQGGLTLKSKDTVEQSSCFAFRKGMVVTFNDEVACRMQTPITNFTGAVPANPLLKLLGKMTDEEVEIEIGDGEFKVIGTDEEEFGIRLEASITLAIDSADKPGKVWIPLEENFLEGINTVQNCASTGGDNQKWQLTCIHIHPKWVEAFDNSQLTRYKVKTAIDQPCLVKRDYIKHIVGLEVTEFNETPSWLHFRNEAGLIFSVRRYMESYVDLTPHIKFEGEPAELPAGLSDAAEKAEISSSENESSRIIVSMKAGKVRIKGIGNTSWYKKILTIKYDGPEFTFMIAPKLLQQIAKSHRECVVDSTHLKINGGNFIYVASLIIPPKVDK